MSFIIKDGSILVKYNEIWNKIKEALDIKLHSMPVYDETYIKAKVRKFNDIIKTNSWSHKIPKESVHRNCISCITIDSVMGMQKKQKNKKQFISLFRRMQV